MTNTRAAVDTGTFCACLGPADLLIMGGVTGGRAVCDDPPRGGEAYPGDLGAGPAGHRTGGARHGGRPVVAAVRRGRKLPRGCDGGAGRVLWAAGVGPGVGLGRGEGAEGAVGRVRAPGVGPGV